MNEESLSILLVEDDDSLRAVLARHVRASGYPVIEATSAEEASRLMNAGARPTLVILDINLPGETGWDFLRGPAMADAGSPPVVVASATTVNPKLLKEFGVAGYLPKPFAIETLLATIERLLNPNGGTTEP